VSQTLQVGPFALPWTVAATILAILAGTALAGLLGRRRGIALDTPTLVIPIAAFVIARLAFVLRFHDSYIQQPLSAIDIRDGGWMPMAGLAAAWVTALAWSWRAPVARVPLAAGTALASAIWAAAAFGAPWLGNSNDQRVPGLTLSTLQGEAVQLDQFVAGRPAVVNLWAGWCPPCLREMPVLQEAQARYPQVRFVFVNQGESLEKVRQHLSRRGWQLERVLLDPGLTLGAQLRQAALPTTLFVDAHGRVEAVRTGELSRATLAERLASLLPPSSTASSHEP
jgi:thiol-disulfide isomerase/thioredoxin